MNILKPVASVYGNLASEFEEIWSNQISEFKKKFKPGVIEVLTRKFYPTDVPILIIKKEIMVEALAFLKNEPGFSYSFLADFTATDELPREPRFDLVFNLLSMQHNGCRIRIKVPIKENEKVPTCIGVWPGANWSEREIWDMFGIAFEGHPDLRRIILDDRWKGHPLRKDYPIKGYQIFPDPMQINEDVLGRN
jgi:NADH-quinone oxidoreductase subunit C